MEQKEINELKAKWRNVESITPWDKLKVDGVYHIPPVLGLARRDIKITKIEEETVSFKRIDGEHENEIGMFHKTSVFAKCMIETKEF